MSLEKAAHGGRNTILDTIKIMCKYLRMNTITVSIGAGRTDLCKLIEKVEAGARVILTNHGQPKAVISAYRETGKPWRVETPDNPKLYGDLQSPVIDDWK
jgi:prevent-host-death family protein